MQLPILNDFRTPGSNHFLTSPMYSDGTIIPKSEDGNIYNLVKDAWTEESNANSLLFSSSPILLFSFLFPSFHITFLFFGEPSYFPLSPLQDSNHEKGRFSLSFLSLIQDTCLTCILHLASSQLVKVKVERFPFLAQVLSSERKCFIYSLPILLAVIEMGELRVEIPEELREEMKELPNVNWQLVVRRTLKRELEEILELKRIISKSKLTKEDVEELSDEINESLAKRFRESLKQR